MYEYTTRVINLDKPELGTRVSSHRCEDFLGGVIEMVAKGYTLRPGEVYASLTGYQCHMDTPAEKVIKGNISIDLTDADLSKLGQDSDIDPARIAAMEGDKLALDKYGEELGVKLNRSNTFKNMLKALEKGLS